MDTSELAGIYNFRELDDRLITSGQPSEEELAAVARAGAEVVVNLAPHDGYYSLPDEPGTVTRLGMLYEHIPVVWDHPTGQDLLDFFSAMERHATRNVYLHCAANMRASAFMLLYRVLCLGWSVADARPDMEAIWTPNDTWQCFLDDMLRSEAR